MKKTPAPRRTNLLRLGTASLLVIALLAGGCAPQAKPFALVGGMALAGAGAAIIGSGGCSEPEDPISGLITAPACAGVEAGTIMVGSMAILTGLAIMIAGAASGSDAPDAPAAAPTTDAQPTPWPAPPPTRSPSAPSGSPLSSLSFAP